MTSLASHFRRYSRFPDLLFNSLHSSDEKGLSLLFCLLVLRLLSAPLVRGLHAPPGAAADAQRPGGEGAFDRRGSGPSRVTFRTHGHHQLEGKKKEKGKGKIWNETSTGQSLVLSCLVMNPL